jgi:GTPase Era involved in 16S rRNA processing
MSDVNGLYYGPISYSPIWVLLGLLFLGFAIGIVVVILYVTRKKEIKTVSTLKVSAPKVVNMNVLRDKYIKLINEAEERFKKRQIKASQCHQQLSLLVRMFYYEALGFHADVMTLSDLKKSNYTALVDLIDSYYPDEFDMLEKGSVANAAEKARQLVREQ